MCLLALEPETKHYGGLIVNASTNTFGDLRFFVRAEAGAGAVVDFEDLADRSVRDARRCSVAAAFGFPQSLPLILFRPNTEATE